MLKRIWTSLAICMCLFAFPSVCAYGTQVSGQDVIRNDETGIPDKALYQGILQELGKQPDAMFTVQEAETIKELEPDASQVQIQCLKGIGCLRGLERLDLGNHNVGDLDGIEALVNLKSLDLSGNSIKSLEKLKGMKSLESLEAVWSDLGSLAGVEELENLKHLFVSSNYLTDLKPLRNLTGLEILDVSRNQLTKLSELAKCRKIRMLYADENRIKSLNGLRKMVDMEELSVWGNSLPNLKEISGMGKLQVLRAGSNQLKKIPDLKKMKLHNIDLTNNRLSAKELEKKLPAKFFKKSYKGMGQDQIAFQNLQCKVSIQKPKGKKISKNTKSVQGRVSVPAGYEVSVGLTLSHCFEDDLMKPKKPVKADKNGNFKIKNLKLSDWAGEEMRIDLYLTNQKTKSKIRIPSDIRFTVKN